MSYKRFYKYEQYIGGVPQGIYRKGEMVSDTEYTTLQECEGGSPSSTTRWVEIQQTVCVQSDLHALEKEQISYDQGSTWSDTGNTRTGRLIEADSQQCVDSYTDWRTVSGEYVCDNFNKYTKEAEYITYDDGETWTPTGRERQGVLLETNSTDCGVIYQWLTVPNDWICSPVDGCGDKYEKQVYQISYDNGVNWSDVTPYRERPGALIETQSSDCGCSPEELYQWVVVSGQYTCTGTYKYALEKEQVSIDGGTTWTDTGDTRAGSLIEADSVDCGYVPPTPPISSEYLTFESLEDNNYIKWDCSTLTIPEAPRTIYYSTDKVTWTSVKSSTSATLITVLNTGGKVYVKANGTNYASPSYYNNFTTSKRVNLSGNIMSLLYSDNFVDKTTLTSTHTFAYLFNTCKIVSIENLVLPATTLSSSCYHSMFSNCTNLTTVPSGLLPATTLVDSCYSAMFYNCSSLATLPSNLLPATTLAYNCYSDMFYHCTSLTTPPDLLAATLAERCYYYMFEGCSSLNYIKCLATDITATDCTNGWVYGVAASGTFVKATSMSSWTTGNAGIPSGWTVQNAS